MSQHDEIPEDLKTLESALRGLSPVRPALDQNALMFRAGQASARRHQWAWQALAASALILAAGLGGMMATGAAGQRIVYVNVGPRQPPVAPQMPESSPEQSPPEGSAPAPRGALAQGSYLELRQRWATADETSEDWLPRPAAPGSVPRFSRNDLMN